MTTAPPTSDATAEMLMSGHAPAVPPALAAAARDEVDRRLVRYAGEWGARHHAAASFVCCLVHWPAGDVRVVDCGGLELGGDAPAPNGSFAWYAKQTAKIGGGASSGGAVAVKEMPPVDAPVPERRRLPAAAAPAGVAAVPPPPPPVPASAGKGVRRYEDPEVTARRYAGVAAKLLASDGGAAAAAPAAAEANASEESAEEVAAAVLAELRGVGRRFAVVADRCAACDHAHRVWADTHATIEAVQRAAAPSRGADVGVRRRGPATVDPLPLFVWRRVAEFLPADALLALPLVLRVAFTDREEMVWGTLLERSFAIPAVPVPSWRHEFQRNLRLVTDKGQLRGVPSLDRFTRDVAPGGTVRVGREVFQIVDWYPLKCFQVRSLSGMNFRTETIRVPTSAFGCVTVTAVVQRKEQTNLRTVDGTLLGVTAAVKEALAAAVASSSAAGKPRGASPA